MYREYRYKDIGKIKSGKRLRKGYIVQEDKTDNKYIRVKDLNNGNILKNQVQFITDEAVTYIKNYKVKKGDILISVVGTVGNIAEVPSSLDGAYLTENCNNLLVNEDICLKKYLKYFLLSNIGKNEINSHIVGSTQPKLPIYGIENFKIIVPNIKVQRKVCMVLDFIDKKIELNSQINENLSEIIKNQYNNFMNELSKYQIVKLKDIAIISSGKRPKVKGSEFEIPLVGASGIMSYTNSYNFNEDIIIIGRVGTLGLVKRYFNKIWASDNTLTIKTEFKNIIENYMKTVDYISLNRASTQPLITQSDISNLEIKFDINEFKKFENSIQVIRTKIHQNEIQNNTLSQLRDILLPKLINGEIDLENIKI